MYTAECLLCRSGSLQTYRGLPIAQHHLNDVECTISTWQMTFLWDSDLVSRVEDIPPVHLLQHTFPEALENGVP